MVAGPGGREVGRVSIRVVPDTSRFRRDLRDALKGLGDEVFNLNGAVRSLRGVGQEVNRVHREVGRLNRANKDMRRGMNGLGDSTSRLRTLFNGYRQDLKRSNDDYRQATDGYKRLGGVLQDLDGAMRRGRRELDFYRNASDDLKAALADQAKWARQSGRAISDQDQAIHDLYKRGKALDGALRDARDSTRRLSNSFRELFKDDDGNLTRMGRGIAFVGRNAQRLGKAFRVRPIIGFRQALDKARRGADWYLRTLRDVDQEANRTSVIHRGLGRQVANLGGVLRRAAKAYRDQELASSRAVRGWRSLRNTYRDVDTLNKRVFPNLNRTARSLMNLGSMADRGRDGIRNLGREAARVRVDRIRELRREVTFERVAKKTARAVWSIGKFPFTTSYRTLQRINRLQKNIRDENSRLRQSIDRVRDGFRRLGSAMSKVIPGFNRTSNASNRARNRILLLTAAVLALIAPIGALISGALTILPSLLGAAGIGAGAVALGLEGIKKAASQLKPQFEKLKKTVSDVFEQRLTPQFAQLGTLFPTMEKGFTQIAHGMADMSQGVVDFLTSAEGMRQQEAIFANTAKLYQNLKPYVTDLTSAFMTLNEEGSKHFDGLSESMNSWSDSFKKNIDSLIADGSMDQMFSGLRGFADGFGIMFNDIYAFGVRAMGQMGQQMGQFFVDFGNTLKNLEPGLINFGNSVLEAFGNFGTSVSPEFSTFLTNLGNTLLALEPTISSVANSILSVLNTAMTALGPAIQAALPGLQSFFNTLATAVNNSLPLVAPALEQLGAAFTKMMENPEFQGALINFITGFADSLSQLLPKVVENGPAILEFATNVLNLATEALPVVVAVMSTVIAAFGALIKMVNTTIDTFVAAKNGIETAVEGIKQAIEGNFSNAGTLLLQAGRDIVMGLVNGMMEMIDHAIGAARSIGSAIINAAKSVLDINSPSKEMRSIGESVGEGLTDGINNGESQVIRAAESLHEALKRVFGDTNFKVNIQVGEYKQAINEIADETANAAGTVTRAGKQYEKGYGEMDDATKKQKELIELRADELRAESRRLDREADTAENRRRKQLIEEQIDMLQEMSDDMDLQAKKMAYENKWGEAFDSILDEIDTSIPPEAESKGLTIMQRLQKGLKDGWGGVQRELKLMADDFGEVFGVANMSEEIDSIVKDTGFGTIPQDFAKATANQALSDLGGGSGVLGGLINEGSTYVFNVMSMDEAMQGKETQQNKDRLKFIGR